MKITTTSVQPREYTYTIPVWIGDEVFQKTLDYTVMTQKDAFSVSRSASIAMSSDYYYCAFTSEAGIRRNIWLVVGDKTGFFTSRSITSVDFTTGCFFPTILPVEDGINDRWIIIFNLFESGDWNLYLTWGNLDGTCVDSCHM